MIYLDSGATSYRKPRAVYRAVLNAMQTCASPGRGGYREAMKASEVVYDCREQAAALFDCRPEQVALTGSCTHGLNTAIRSLVKPGKKVAITGFEHNAVVRPLHGIGAEFLVAGRKLFDWEDTLFGFEAALKQGAQAAVFTHVSNVFGYILPVEEMAALCRQRRIPFVLDAAQSAGTLPVKLKELGADFIAMPGHKGLLGPQGTGLLLCADRCEPLLYGGTGNASRSMEMPEDLPERLEAGTLNVPGYAGLAEGLRYVRKMGENQLFQKEHRQLQRCVRGLRDIGFRVFSGMHQAATVSFQTKEDCEEIAGYLADRGIAVRAGLHCAPMAHESAGTLETGTVRVSFDIVANDKETDRFLRVISKFGGKQK